MPLMGGNFSDLICIFAMSCLQILDILIHKVKVILYAN